MAISEKDVKKLWGLAAGICSHPDCNTDCIVFVDADDPTLIGEMAHVIGKKPRARRGRPEGGPDEYENLILLCPTHHRLIDKAPEGSFPEEKLLNWKKDHETAVRSRLAAPLFSDKKELCQKILRLLIQNHSTWKTYGPESETALKNPFSNVPRLWELRKLSSVLPGNKQIVNLIEQNAGLFSMEEYRVCAKFMEHAAGFEASSYTRLDNVPRFPAEFEEMIRNASLE